jgi:acyl-coenzyme A synthetase/AMP-(fatty) acid ligase
MIEQRSVINLLLDITKKLNISPTDSFVNITSMNFDISILELFLPLINGSTLHILSDDVVADPAQLANYINKNYPSIIQATPTVWATFVDSLSQHKKSRIVALVGGEMTPQKLAKKLLQYSTTAWNVYGPTEATIWAMYNEFKHEDNIRSLGSTFANIKVYIVDENQNLISGAGEGELCISGACLARGYLNDEELTSKCFVKNEHSSLQGYDRLYRTGDLVRLNSNNDIEFIGRKDNQVKIRGHRIELGEIENILSKYSQIGQVIVKLCSYNSQNHLVAYYVADASNDNISLSNELMTQQIKLYALEYLPSYMAPTFYIRIDVMPISLNGKIDINNLPEINDCDENSSQSIVSYNKTEKLLLHIWEKCLKINNITLTSDFFTIGGNSLLIIQVHAKIIQSGYLLTIIDLFKYPTIKSLSEFLVNKDGKPHLLNVIQGKSRRKNMDVYKNKLRRKRAKIESISEGEGDV